MKEVVVTAYSLLSPIGRTPAEFREALFAGRSGVREIRGGFAPADFPVPYAARVPEFPVPDFVSRWVARPSIFVKSAGYLLDQIADSIPEGLPIDAILSGHRELNAFSIATESLRRSHFDSADFGQLLVETPMLLATRFLQERKKIPVAPDRQICLGNACATGNAVLGMALQQIRSGKWDRALVMAIEMDPHPLQMMGLFLLGALSIADVPAATASRPFSADRAGFVKGEGAAMLLLEARDLAEKRGAEILGSVSGFASTTDGWRLTDGHPEGRGVIAAMRLALRDAGISPDDIDYINAHGTSTPLGDVLEVQAIKEVFQSRARQIPVSSLKSQIGHSTIACGALEAVACLMMLQEQKVAATINYGMPDPKCDLDFVPNHSREAHLRFVLSNNSGFGGQNSCLILKA